MSAPPNSPAGWFDVTLGDVCTKPQYGWTTSAASSGKVKLLRTTDLTHGPITWDTVPFCAEVPGSVQKYLVEPGDLLISRAGSVGVSVMVEDVPVPAVFASYLIRLRAAAPVRPRYLKHFLSSPAYWGQISDMSSGIALPNINGTKLRGLRLPLPGLLEQDHIVELLEDHLSRLDAAAASLQAARSRVAKLLRSVTDVTLDAASGVPIQWGDCGQTLSGKTFPSADYATDGIRLIRPGNLEASGSVSWSASNTKYLPEAYRATSAKYVIRGGEVLMNLTAQSLADEFLGRVCMTREGECALLNQRIACLRSERASSRFLYWSFKTSKFRDFISRQNSGSLIQHISTKQLDAFELKLPSMEDQELVCRRLDEAEGRIVRIAQQLSRLEPLREQVSRSLFHAAFTGQLTKTWRNTHHG